MRRIGFAIAALLAAPALLALRFADGPPARVTGGHGEDSCVACHAGNAVNDPAGRLTVSGFPERYEPGRTYDLALTLSRPPRISAAGFQLAVRLAASNASAGTIAVADEARMGLLEERGVQFAQHRLADIVRPEDGSVSWKLRWTAPNASADVVVHAAAVAANGDASQAGDHVYTLAITLPGHGDVLDFPVESKLPVAREPDRD